MQQPISIWALGIGVEQEEVKSSLDFQFFLVFLTMENSKGSANDCSYCLVVLTSRGCPTPFFTIKNFKLSLLFMFLQPKILTSLSLHCFSNHLALMEYPWFNFFFLLPSLPNVNDAEWCNWCLVSVHIIINCMQLFIFLSL